MRSLDDLKQEEALGDQSKALCIRVCTNAMERHKIYEHALSRAIDKLSYMQKN